ncbi:DNA-methyltransferase [Ottowia sp. VDI28]|uniref:DNA-methyltransferase n=1 Tax=Ottowia sp. VDI28 TaxID=3133968 RepID=UPI003C2FB80F
MADNSVDSIVTDPPYGLTNNGGGPSAAGKSSPAGRAQAGAARGGFMGMKWDSAVPPMEVWRECIRVLKPGGYLLSFFGTRTYHRGVVNIEDAGFEVRDQIGWVFGSGFPKSHNGRWGGTALKPAWEPIVVARKPLIGTVAENWAEWGTGALNIDGCRIGTDAVGWGGSRGGSDDPTQSGGRNYRLGEGEARPVEGRWPANLIHDGSDEVLAAFPTAPGQLADASTNSEARKTQNVYGALRRGRGDEPSAHSENSGAVGFSMKPGMRRLDSGSAARFFYCAKASRQDRNEGMSDPGPQFKKGSTLRDAENLIANGERKGNHHPTVKPTELMAYLCRLVTPAGGVVLDPYMGSGSTGKACMQEGLRFIGIERESDYIEIARARIERAQRQGHQPSLLEVA